MAFPKVESASKVLPSLPAPFELKSSHALPHREDASPRRWLLTILAAGFPWSKLVLGPGSLRLGEMAARCRKAVRTTRSAQERHAMTNCGATSWLRGGSKMPAAEIRHFRLVADSRLLAAGHWPQGGGGEKTKARHYWYLSWSRKAREIRTKCSGPLRKKAWQRGFM